MKPYLGWPWFSLSLPRADAAAIWVGHYRERRVKGVRGLQFAVEIGTTSTVTMISRVRFRSGDGRDMPFGKEESTRWLSKGTILSATLMVMLTLCIGYYRRNRPTASVRRLAEYPRGQA